MNVQEIKKDADELTDIEKVLNEFTHFWIKPIKKQSTSKPLLAQLKRLQHSVAQAKEGEMINQKLKSLAHHLVNLRITTITNDKKMRSLILDRFLHDPFLQIKNIVDEVNGYEKQIEEVQRLYENIQSQVAGTLPLEQKVSILDSAHQFTFQNILITIKKQKQLLKLVGHNFIKETRQARKVKQV